MLETMDSRVLLQGVGHSTVSLLAFSAQKKDLAISVVGIECSILAKSVISTENTIFVILADFSWPNRV